MIFMPSSNSAGVISPRATRRWKDLPGIAWATQDPKRDSHDRRADPHEHPDDQQDDDDFGKADAGHVDSYDSFAMMLSGHD